MGWASSVAVSGREGPDCEYQFSMGCVVFFSSFPWVANSPDVELVPSMSQGKFFKSSTFFASSLFFPLWREV